MNMPGAGDGQRSPRDAIRDWLRKADTDRPNDQKEWHGTQDPTGVIQDRAADHRPSEFTALSVDDGSRPQRYPC